MPEYLHDWHSNQDYQRVCLGSSLFISEELAKSKPDKLDRLKQVTEELKNH